MIAQKIIRAEGHSRVIQKLSRRTGAFINRADHLAQAVAFGLA